MASFDLFCEVGGDFTLTPNGDLQLATGWDLIRQNIERAIFTNSQGQQSNGSPIAADYIFHPEYGLSGGALIGNTFNQQFINLFSQKVSQAVLSAQTGNADQPPVINITNPSPNQLMATITVFPTGGQQQQLQVLYP